MNALISAGFGVVCAIAFAPLQNGLNRERRWWLSAVLVFVAVAVVNLLIAYATGRFR